MNFLVITSDGLPVYLKEEFGLQENDSNLHGITAGIRGTPGLIVLQEKKSEKMTARFHFFQLIKNIFIRHVLSPAHLQTLVAMTEDITYNIEGYGKFLLKKGHYILIPQTDQHMEAELKAGRDYRIFEALYTLDNVKEFAEMFPFLQKLLMDTNGKWVPEAKEAGEKALDTIREMLYNPYTEKKLENYYYNERLKRFLFLVIDQASASPDLKLGSDFDAACKARDIIIASINKDPDLNELSRRLLIPVYRLKESFRKLFSHNPDAYVRKRRMEMAWEMVTGTAKPIKVIASELGFKKSQSFATKFKRCYGISPHVARTNVRAGTSGLK
jgi:AraC-like DNA-binding protein